MDSGGKLLLISDLEGCLPVGAPPDKLAQSRFMCSPEFFAGVKEHLKNPKNKVAFLGDYFDQGDMVVDSINGIMDVYNTAPKRVIIIVGNRDVNKFRLVYEMMDTPQTQGDKLWPIWKDRNPRMPNEPSFHEDYPVAKDLKNRLRIIVSKSMGAGYPVRIGQGLDETQAGYLLLKIFSPVNAEKYAKEVGLKSLKNNKGRNMGFNVKYNDFVNNARNLYRVAKIVHYDSDFKTLMSHGGGMDTFFFHYQDYYTTIKKEALTDPTYFGKIETARLALMKPPVDKIKTFDECVYNYPLKEVVSQILGSRINGTLPSAPAEPSGDYYLLQALGLKPNGTEHFTSFIQSCDNTGCKGPAAGDSGKMYSPEYATFQDTLVENGVNVLASGHVPHCAPVPLVYKRSDNGKLLYALNDTSNGYRPADRVKGLESYPLTYVKEGGTAVGVGMLPALEPVDMSSDTFGPMFGEWTLETAPVFNAGSKQVEYAGKGALTFPARTDPKNPFLPAIFVKPTSGGRRRRMTRKGRKASRKQHKTRRH